MISRLRKKDNYHYTNIDNTVFLDYRLSYKAKGLLCQMLSLPDGWEYSIEGLAKLSSDGRTAVATAVDELERCGYLTRVQVRHQGKFVGNEYVISACPADHSNAEKPMTENPISEKPMTDSPMTEKQAQYITNISTTKESNTNKSNTKKILSSEFEKLWAMYPRKQGGKDKTFGYYERARKNGTTYEEVEQGIRAYKEYLRLSGTGDKYIKMASTFFSQKGWQDDYSVAQPKTNPNVGWDETTQQGLRSIFGRN